MGHNSKRRRKHRPRIERRTLPGAAPGAVVADPLARPPILELVAYGPESLVELRLERVAQIREYRGAYPVVWLNVNGLGDAATIEQIGEAFGLHRLALEDVVNTHQRAKVDAYDQELFIVARMADVSRGVRTEQLSLFVGRDFVLTFQEEAGDCWKPLRDRLRRQVGRVRQAGPDYLVYSLLDAVIDDYFPLLEACGERLDRLEDNVVTLPAQQALDELHAIKSELLMLRRAIWPHREMLAALTRDESPLIADGTRVFLRDCYDHVIQLVDLTETYRELSADLRDLAMSAISNRINETMRVLTIIATVFIPITFIASIYGMNFDPDYGPWSMPELRWKWGYPAALLSMLFTVVAMWWYFRRKGWLTPAAHIPMPADSPEPDAHSRPQSPTKRS